MHGWDWETFKKLIEEVEDTIVLKKVYTGETITKLSDAECEEDRLSWDNSPEQYELMSDTDDEDFEIMLEPKKLFESTEEEVSLTSTSDDDVFFASPVNTQKLNPKLKRNVEIRRPNTDTMAAKSSQVGLASPETPSKINLAQKQNLGNVLPKRRPILPETVILGPEIQQFQTALASVNLPPDDPASIEQEVPREIPDAVHEVDHTPNHQRQLRR